MGSLRTLRTDGAILGDAPPPPVPFELSLSQKERLYLDLTYNKFCRFRFDYGDLSIPNLYNYGVKNGLKMIITPSPVSTPEHPSIDLTLLKD